MSKKNNDIKEILENITIESMDSVMNNRCSIYAKDVIQDRAIPNLRDGLKPVQRRIIYSMYKSDNTSEHATRKCARIVGDVMGKYHPHGDSSIYEALVRMSQDWKMSEPLIKFQGNNGSIDNDPAAAYRYTEAKLNEFCSTLYQDIDKDTVDYCLNFDDTAQEPIVFPSKIPNLYINGATGIAYGLATEIPPHNLNEMCQAVIYRIDHPNSKISDFSDIILGPDFPTGGVIYNSDGLKSIYETGKGRIELAAKTEIITSDKKVNKIIIHEIPYNVVKIDLVYSIDKIRKSKSIDGILNVIDESAGDQVKIVLELKKDINPETILNYLLMKTQLKVFYNANIVAIDRNVPKTLDLLTYLDVFISFQKELISRKSNYELKKANIKLHLVDGLLKAISIVDKIIETIKKSKDKQESKVNLIKFFGFSEPQAEAIVMMRLYKLSNIDLETYKHEKNDLELYINYLNDILSSDKNILNIVKKDLKDIIKKFSRSRRTDIIEYDTSKAIIDKRELITKEDCYITITRDGYFNKSSIKSHDSSNNQLPTIKDNDVFIMSQICNTLDYILSFTNKGNYIFTPVYLIEEGKYKDQGKHINYITNLPFDEYIIKTVLIKDFNKNDFVVLLSKNGQIKRTLIKEFFVTRYSKPICCIKLSKYDELSDITISSGNSRLLVINKDGTGNYYNENEFASTGLKSFGVKAISSIKNTSTSQILSFEENEKSKVLLVTNKLCYRLLSVNQLTLNNRLNKNQFIFKSFKSDTHELIYASKINDNKKIYITDNNNNIIEYEITDYSLTPIEKYCKRNIDIKNVDNINYLHNFETYVIDENTPCFEQKNINNENKEEEDSFRHIQVSIFDDMGD